ncbi:sigma-70 family RNA polymerase sigma factor [Candidatus Peregrinibacteria bacterium]|nr:sigma-70 family RNA polymerase sigma factor [Candidatus Peregrinibacteria bacterium]
MEKVKSGNIDYMTEIFNRYNNQILNYFFRLSGNLEDSQDLTQSVFLRLLKYRKSFNQSKSFKSWIYGVSRNILNNHYKLKVIKIEYSEIADKLPETTFFDDENDLKLYQSINKLSDEYKELIILSKFQGLKYKEIAEMYSTTEASIKNKVFRALDKLRIIIFENE